MSSNLLICSDVGCENESRIKLDASCVQDHAVNSVHFSNRMGGDSCHVKPDRKHRTDGRYSSIGDGLENSISNEAKGKIERVLGEVKNFSDVEKFVLYLKLPTGDTSSEELRRTPTPYSKQTNRVEQSLAYTWIKSHLEEDIEICLPKQEVFDEYKQYCENHSLVPLCNADFGKLMKTVFPNVKPRRLGQRGQSRYCYGGLRKKLDVEAPSLPEIDVTLSQQKQDEKTEDNHLYRASCDLVLEWAVKLLEQNFNDMRNLAEYLVSNLYVNSKSVSAFTVIAAMEEAGAQKVSSLFSNTTGGDRHRETQLQLQRKLHERENVSRQKKKLQQMKEDNVAKQRQERQTPLNTSPTGQQDMMSPRKIFEESEDMELQTHSGRPLIQEVYGVRPQRQRSTSSARQKKNKSITPQEAMDKGGGTSSGEDVQVPVQTLLKEDQQGIPRRMSVEMGNRQSSELDSTLEMMSVEDLVLHRKDSRDENWKTEDAKSMDISEGPSISSKTESRVPIPMSALISEHSSVLQLPSVCSETSPSILEDKAHLRRVSLSPPHLSDTSSNQPTISQHVSESAIDPILSISRHDMSLNTPSNTAQNNDNPDPNSRLPSKVGAAMSIPIKTFTNIPVSMAQQLSFLPKEQTVSNRSAFVPFSQVHRKDNSEDEPDFLPDSDSMCLPEKAQTILITESGKQILIMAPQSNMLNLPPGVDSNDSPIQLVPASSSSNLPSTPGKSSASTVSSEPQSPTTPKKNRSRFTPIRPKGSPAKTVSSILKEQKNPEKPESEKIDRSKSVSTLLKEKREREAKMQVSMTGSVVSQTVSVSGVGALSAFPAPKLPLKQGETASQTPQLNIIILNPVNPGVGTKAVVSMASEVSTSVTTTLTTASSHRFAECCSSTVDITQRRERSRTASLSEYDITSPSNIDNLNMSDLSDSSVGDEKPSKLAKIVDSEQNVSSRPGSRCSVDRETPSFLGRKRKLFISSQSVEGIFMDKHPARLLSNDEDPDFVMEEDRRPMSCNFGLEKFSQKEFNDKLKLAERRNCPDISDLESDALKDISIPDPSNIIKKGKELCKQKQDTGVGVTSLSLRKSQQRLLEEKPILDERMKTFFQQKESHSTSEESQGSELPPDVAEFITDSMTQSRLSEQMEVTPSVNTSSTRSLSRQEVVQEIYNSLTKTTQNIPPNPSPLPSEQSDVTVSQRSHSARIILQASPARGERAPQDNGHFRMPYRSQSVTDASRAPLDVQVQGVERTRTQPSPSIKESQSSVRKSGTVEFASPQRPLRRQRTPSVENAKKREASVERHAIQRETSVERTAMNTPHSDPGYSSVGPSPILQSVLVSTGAHVCDSTYSSMSSTSFSICRPDSAHSVNSDGITPSPMASPRFQTSTPYHLKSPSLTPNQGSVLNESVPVQSFMPIQGSSLKLDNNTVTLIRPVVTIASQSSQSTTVSEVVMGDMKGENAGSVPICSKQAPPSYSAAMQDRKTKKGKKEGAFQTLPLLNLSGGATGEIIRSQSFYFSDKLAQLSRKTSASEKGTAKERTNRSQSIKTILGHLTSPIDQQYQNQDQPQSLRELPDAGYQGNQPNVNMFDIESIVTYKSPETDVTMTTEGDLPSQGVKPQALEDQMEFSARRNLNEMLEQDFNGDDLQATLEDLRAMDSQYFADNFDIGSEKRQEM